MAHQLRREDVGFIDRAPIRVHASLVMGSAPDQVWPFVADASAWTSWFDGMTEAAYISDPPHGVGSRRQVVVKGLRVTEDIVEFDEPHRFAFVVIEANRPGMVAMVELVTLDATANGTTVTYQQAIELAWWLRPLAPVVRKALTRAVTTSLAELGQLSGKHT
jgi:hypothetical protein